MQTNHQMYSTIGEHSVSSELIHFLLKMIESLPVGTSAMLNSLHILILRFQNLNIDQYKCTCNFNSTKDYVYELTP